MDVSDDTAKHIRDYLMKASGIVDAKVHLLDDECYIVGHREVTHMDSSPMAFLILLKSKSTVQADRPAAVNRAEKVAGEYKTSISDNPLRWGVATDEIEAAAIASGNIQFPRGWIG